MRFRSLTVLLGLTLLTLPRPAAAQEVAAAGLRATPTQYAATIALQPDLPGAGEPRATLVDDPYQHGTRKEGVALMVVGLAGIITGLVVDEALVTILGAGVGGLGLYFYLR